MNAVTHSYRPAAIQILLLSCLSLESKLGRRVIVYRHVETPQKVIVMLVGKGGHRQEIVIQYPVSGPGSMQVFKLYKRMALLVQMLERVIGRVQ